MKERYKGKHDRKKTDRTPAPVFTGHDERGAKRGGETDFENTDSDAPDGVSGNWS